MQKVLLITNIPNPYRIPLYNELADQLLEKGFRLKIIFGAETYKRRFFNVNNSDLKVDYHILDDKGRTFSDDGEKTYFLYKGLYGEIKQYEPDVVLVAGFSSATMKVFRYFLQTKTPYIIISGTIEKGNRNNSIIRKFQRKLLISKAGAFVAYGSLAKKYLLNMFAPADKIFIGRNTVDTTFFADTTAQQRIELNSKGNINKITHFTYLGYLVPRKNVSKILDAVLLLSKTQQQFKVDIIGDGTEKEKLEKFVTDNNLDPYVTFHGFKQKEDIPFYFARSSGLLFQTDYDIWGLVVNEAMAAGVPCLASNNAGSTHDLVQDGVNGFILDFNNPISVCEKLKWIIQHPDDTRKMGQNAAQFINENVTLRQAAEGYVRAIQCSLKTAVVK